MNIIVRLSRNGKSGWR